MRRFVIVKNMWQGGPEKSFNQAQVDALVGKYIIAGITYVDKSEQVIERKQFHGIIESVDSDEGIKIRLKGKSEGEYIILSPDLDTLQPAPPGTYSLKSTGEEVVDHYSTDL